MTRPHLPLVVAAALCITACSGTSSPAPTATATVTVTQTAPPSSAADAAPSTSTAAMSEASTGTSSPGPAGEEPGESDPDANMRLKDGQTATFGAGIKVTAKWGTFDSSVKVGDGPYDQGCTWVTFTAQNTGSEDMMASNPAADGSNAAPFMMFSMTAGDTLREVGGVALSTAGEWPKRLKAGKTETWRQCFLAGESEQHITLTAHGGSGSPAMPLASWSHP